MTVEVGDKVRIVANEWGSTNDIGDVGFVTEINLRLQGCRVQVEGGPETINWSKFSDLELVQDTPTPISTLCREKMEDHMGKGEYVRAVKWAQLAEQAEALEDE